MNRKAIIFGLKGTKLTKDEARLLKKNKPWGIILFSRNIKNLFQLKSLVSQIKNCTNDRKYPILIDLEGGSGARLNKIVVLSLLRLPLTVGFISKVFLLKAVFNHGNWPILFIIVFTSFLAMGYAWKIIEQIWMNEPI